MPGSTDKPLTPSAALRRIRELLGVAARNKPLMLGGRDAFNRDLAVETYIRAVDEVIGLLAQMSVDGDLALLEAMYEALPPVHRGGVVS